MPGLSIHVVDVSRGVVAAGMRVRVDGPAGLLADQPVSANGLVQAEALAATLPAGRYTARFFVAQWYAQHGVALPAIPFLDVVDYAFGIADPQEHYHLPMKLTPWGLSCFRGGA